MTSFFAVFDTVLGGLRVALFWSAAALAVVFAVDWLVRTRRINPFNPVARFFRTSVDPLLAPVERRVVRAGGMPSSAPWWALVVVVVGGIVLISLLGFVRNQLMGIMFAAEQGPRGILRLLVSLTFSLLQIALFIRVISSWFRVSPYSPWIRWTFQITEPILAPLRHVIPNIGMIDITPIVAILLLNVIQAMLESTLTQLP
jgi:YggT family protein